MHPFNIQHQIKDHGYWYTYWYLTCDDLFECSKLEAIWLIWISRQMMLHHQRKTLFTRVIDKLS